VADRYWAIAHGYDGFSLKALRETGGVGMPWRQHRVALQQPYLSLDQTRVLPRRIGDEIDLRAKADRGATGDRGSRHLECGVELRIRQTGSSSRGAQQVADAPHTSRHGPEAARLQPEKRLMLAVLEDAIETLFKTAGARHRAGRSLFAETMEWFTPDDTSWPFSFVNICEALGLSPSRVRLVVARCSDLRERAVASRRGGRRSDWPLAVEAEPSSGGLGIPEQEKVAAVAGRRR